MYCHIGKSIFLRPSFTGVADQMAPLAFSKKSTSMGNDVPMITRTDEGSLTYTHSVRKDSTTIPTDQMRGPVTLLPLSLAGRKVAPTEPLEMRRLLVLACDATSGILAMRGPLPVLLMRRPLLLL